MTRSMLNRIQQVCMTVFLTMGSFAGDAKPASVFDLSLEELLEIKVSVASRWDEIVREAPAVLTVVTRAEIEALGARNLMDVIDRLPSMQVVGHAGFYGNKTQIRAQPNSSQDRHTLILLNGRPVRENINGGNNAYFYLGFPISAIESIEIIRGPGSVLYGSNAFAAVINIKTRHTTKGTTDYELGMTYGTYETVDYNASVIGQTHGVDVLSAIRISRSEGPEIAWTDSAGRFDALHYSDDTDAAYFNASTDWGALQAAYHRYRPGDFGTLGSLTEAIYITDVEAFFADGGLNYPITDALTAHLNVTLNTFDWNGSNDGINEFKRRWSRNLIVEPMVNYMPVEDLKLVIGGTVEYDEFGGRELFNEHRNIYSLYTQADYQLTPWLKPLIGVQFNKIEGIEDNHSPRIGLVLTPGEQWGAKLLYSEAFRRAFAAEGYLDSSFLLGNPALDPETIETYEAQINYQNQWCQIDLTYFHSKQNVIEVDFSERPLRFINQPGHVTTEGLELTGRVYLNARWQALGSAMTQSTDNNTPEPLMYPNYPDNMIKAGLIGTIGWFDIGIFNSYFSSGSLWHDRFNHLQANVACDVSPLLKLEPQRITLSVFADNILDEKNHQRPSDTGENEPIPHRYGRRIYATAKLIW